MKNILFLIILPFTFSSVGFAKECDSLDVFEEFAIVDAELLCEDFFIETEKNTTIESKLKYKAEKDVIAEIVTKPRNGEVVLTDTKGSFTYTPNKDWLGTDSFQFRIKEGSVSSNISYCGITVKEKTDDAPEPWFIYEDMRTHWGNYSAVKLVEEDVIKGERIGKRYFFHPETKMRRIDVIEYILAALKVDFDDVDKNDTHIFEDSKDYPEYINHSAYLANKIGFLRGVREGEKIYLRPYEYINRAEIIRMIDIAMSSKTKSGEELSFIDKAAIPDWAIQSVKNLVGYGIIHGFDDNTLRPYDKITKAQAAEMIYQMIKYKRESSEETIATRIKHEFYGKLTV